MKRSIFTLLASSVLASASLADTNLYLDSTLDLGPLGLDVFGGTSGSDAGFYPSSLATDGVNAWIVGWNGTNAAARTGMVRVLNAFGGGTTQVQFVTNAAVSTTPSLRGYIGVTLDPGTGNVIATYDEGAPVANGIAAYDAFSGVLDWQLNIRGTSQGAMDPGFASADSGFAYVAFGSGRRWLYNPADGSQLYGSTNGFIFYPGVGSTNNRSIAFQSNGDCYVRAANDVYKAVRSGGNATSSRVLFVDLTDAPAVQGHNMCIANFNKSDFVVFNDRPVTTSTQAFSSVVKAVRASDGTTETLNFLNGSGSAPADIAIGNGYYDLDYSGGYLYVLDFLNRKVYRFAQSPTSQVLSPSGFEILEGQPFGGNVASLAASDDDRVFILSDENIPNGTIRIDYSGANVPTTSIAISVEVSASRNDLSTFIDLRNQVTSAYVNSDFHISSLTDVTRNFTLSSNPWDYVSGTGEMNLRIRWIPTGDLEAADGWSEQVDLASVTIN